MSETKLRMKFGNIEFEIESDSETVEKERKSFLETLPGIISLSSNFIVMDSQNQSKILDETRLVEDNTTIPKLADVTINTFIGEKGFATDNDKCLGVIYYMTTYENCNNIDSISLRDRMKEAKLILPQNPSQCFGQLTKKGFIQPNGEIEKGIKYYYLTEEGKNYINTYVKKEKKKSTTIKRNPSKAIESIYSNLTREDLSLEKYPNVNDIKATKDKIMLTMYLICNENKGEYFTVNDLIHIMSNIFNEKVTKDMVSGIFKRNPQYFNKRNVQGNNKITEYKLLNLGNKYVEKNILNQ